MFRTRVPIRALSLVALFGSVLVAARGDDDKQKQIADVEKQLAELQKKLGEMKKAPAPATPAAAKKPLTLAEADTWKSVRGTALSNDGKWFASRVGAAEGAGEVTLRSIADGKETKFPGGGGFAGLAFSFDSKWFAFTVPPVAPKPGTPPGLPRAKPKVVLVNLATAEKTEFEGMSSVQFSGEAATHAAFRKAADVAATTPGAAPAPAGPPATAGSDLVLRELATGAELVLGNVAEFSFDKKGTWLVMVIDAAGQIGNGVHLRDMKTGGVFPVETGRASYRGLGWNEDTTAFTLLKASEDKAYDAKWHTLLGFADLGPKPTRTAYDPKDDKTFPADMAVSPNASTRWTDDGAAIIFGIAEQKKKDEPKKEAAPAPKKDDAKKEDGKKDDAKKDEPKKEEPKKDAPVASAAAGPKPDMAIWHWKDERLQPMQQVQAQQDKLATFACVYRVKEKKFVRLADDALKNVTTSPKHAIAIGRDSRAYEYMANLDGRRYADYASVDMTTGARKPIATKVRYFFGTSPTGTHAIYYDAGHFTAFDLAAGKAVNITEKITGTAFIDTDDDHNVEKPPTRPVGWGRDGKHVLISDGWDIWKVAIDGSGGENLTVNGKKDGVRYQGFSQFEADPKPGFDLTKPAIVNMYGEWTKKDGFGRWTPGKPGVETLAWADANYGPLAKARNAEVYAFTRETYVEYPDYYITDATFKDPKKVTAANPQQADYAWSPGVKLVDYKGLDGKPLQAALFLPAGYEPGKKYPTVVYIYEKLSQGLHRYSPPATWAVGSIYTSNGYAVLMPDITYKLNDPGKSAVACVIPALDAAVATGVVDGANVGLQGHSWGGYQTAYLVTQTTRFKAACAGAALTDLVSMYSSVYWNSGSANQPIFESSQGRFTAGYWDQQEAYIRNSPVYFAKDVKTPLLMLHNDKDGAVDFTQGVEYYNTLRRLQKPVVMLQYKGENHGLSKPENRKDYATRMTEFFDHYLKGKPAPDWWTAGVPHLKLDDHLKSRKP